jgi:nitrite reductase/ring-hydroxylating ferredoxin subunit
MSDSSRTCVSVYRRTVRAGLGRVWENVFDWEHLPWLHSSSFSRIEHIASGSWGWSARLDLQPPTGQDILLELVRNAGENRYVARTLEGPGAGTEIWTRLTPDGATRTRVEVEFHVPGVEPAGAETVGAAYRRLYARLWDEDEAMMLRRTAQLAARGAPAPAAPAERELGTLAELRPRLPLAVELRGRRYRVVAVRDALAVHSSTCPHLLGPLDECPVEKGRIRCPWHGYEFDVRSGWSTDGRGLRLAPPPRLEIDPATSTVRLLG